MKTTATQIAISSEAFKNGERIPQKYTGEGKDYSPPLSWSGIPQEAKEIAIIVDDPDAPTPEPWVHWVIYKIPSSVTSLPENIDKTPVPKNLKESVQGVNSSRKFGYMGPMPPQGHGIHHYYFKIYALDAPVEKQQEMHKKDLLKAMQNHILAEGELMGTYER